MFARKQFVKKNDGGRTLRFFVEIVRDYAIRSALGVYRFTFGKSVNALPVARKNLRRRRKRKQYGFERICLCVLNRGFRYGTMPRMHAVEKTEHKTYSVVSVISHSVVLEIRFNFYRAVFAKFAKSEKFVPAIHGKRRRGRLRYENLYTVT